MTPTATASLGCWRAEPMSAPPTWHAMRQRLGIGLGRQLGCHFYRLTTWVSIPDLCTERNAMATVRQRRAAARVVSTKGEAIADLMLEVAQFFFRLRAVGQKTGLITSWGGGAFGFMRSLALLGPLTVPQIAQMRPTSRQRMQRLADELAAEGLVEFIDNPPIVDAIARNRALNSR